MATLLPIVARVCPEGNQLCFVLFSFSFRPQKPSPKEEGIIKFRVAMSTPLSELFYNSSFRKLKTRAKEILFLA
tara:strand:+ start:1335 stop:1556 length:222 start_codon:yes stop_codon:yes gene_type:complete